MKANEVCTHVCNSHSFHTARAGVGYSVDYGRLGVEWAIIATIYVAVVAALRAPAAPKP